VKLEFRGNDTAKVVSMPKFAADHHR